MKRFPTRTKPISKPLKGQVIIVLISGALIYLGGFVGLTLYLSSERIVHISEPAVIPPPPAPVMALHSTRLDASAPLLPEDPAAELNDSPAPDHSSPPNPQEPHPPAESEAISVSDSEAPSAHNLDTNPMISPAKTATPSTIPEGEPPPGVFLHDALRWTTCWDRAGFEYRGKSCGQIDHVQHRLYTRLYVVNECKSQHSGEGSEGELEIGMELDFGNQTVSFWKGNKTTLANAEDTIECLQRRMKEFPLQGLTPKFDRYRLFAPITFSTPSSPDSHLLAGRDDGEALQKARRVTVIRDRVRVRARPVDGEILGHVAQGSQVLLLDQLEGWCRIITMRQNAGWMVCWALEID